MKLSPLTMIAAAALAFAKHALAVPNVTVIPVGPGCAAYPGYGTEGPGVSGPFIAVAEQTGLAIDERGLNAQYYDGDSWGYVTTPAFVDSANITMRCANDTGLQVQTTTADGNGTIWQSLVVSGDPNHEGGLGFAFPEDPYPSIPVEPHWHFIDGEQIPGVYLGAKGVTTWGFANNRAGFGGEYYLLRLMAPGFNEWQLGELDSTGFIRVTYRF